MTWTAALDLYGTDKPDLRFGMKLCDLSEVFAATDVKPSARRRSRPCVWRAARTLAQSPRSMTDAAKELGAKGLAWFRITGDGLDSPLARYLNDTETRHQKRRRRRVGDMVFCVADEYVAACKVSARCA